MSLTPILWALKSAPAADATERLVLTLLAERASEDGTGAFPARDTLAADALVDPKTIQRVLKKLTDRGLIKLGDQSLARYIQPQYRPPVYDLMIPYSWFPDVDRVNKDRMAKGLKPLTREGRPDLAPAPEKKRRSDKGKPRPKKLQDSQSPLGLTSNGSSEGTTSPSGGTDNPARGDYQSQQGGLRDPRTSPKNLHEEPLSPPAPAPEPAPAADPAPGDAERETTPAAPQDKPADPATAVTEAWRRARGAYPNPMSEARIRTQAAALLAAGWELAHVTALAEDMARTQPTWTDLGRHADHWTPPAAAAPADSPTAADPGLPEWCGRCGEDYPDNVLHNPQLRVVEDPKTGRYEPCPDCHPATVAAPAAA